MNFADLSGIPAPVFFLIAMVELVAKGFGLWHAARNNQRNWFIAILAVNTIGILPLVYLKFFQKKQA